MFAKKINRLFTFTATFILLALPMVALAKPPLVELFTSTQCPKCPAAEAHMAELTGENAVFALSYHIDLSRGRAKEPYATKQTEARGWLYRKRDGQSFLFTPNMVAMGGDDASAASAKMVEYKLIHAARPQESGIHIEKLSEGIRLIFPEKQTETKDIWMVTYDKIKRKPNHKAPSNIVRTIERIGTWKGKAARYRISQFSPQAGKYIAIIVQKPNAGDVLDYVTASRF